MADAAITTLPGLSRRSSRSTAMVAVGRILLPAGGRRLKEIGDSAQIQRAWISTILCTVTGLSPDCPWRRGWECWRCRLGDESPCRVAEFS